MSPSEHKSLMVVIILAYTVYGWHMVIKDRDKLRIVPAHHGLRHWDVAFFEMSIAQQDETPICPARS